MSGMNPLLPREQRDRLLVVFGAACLFFSTLEYLIPKPPFFRIGLANLPVLLALPLLSGPELLVLTLIKVLGQGLAGGTLFSYVALFSAGGSLASLLVMWAFHRLFGARIGWLGLSLLGAASSNAVQMALSVGIVFGPGAWFIIPVFMAFGLAAGLVVGLGAMVVASHSVWYHGLVDRFGLKAAMPPTGSRPDNDDAVGPEAEPAAQAPRRRGLRLQLRGDHDILGRIMGPGALGLLALGVFPAFLASSSLLVRSIEVAFWVLMSLLAGKRLQPLYFLGMVASVTFFNLFMPSGQVLARIGGLDITADALTLGLNKGLGFVGQVFISLALVRPGLRLPGGFGAQLAQVMFGYQLLLTGKKNMKGRPLLQFVDISMENLESGLDAARGSEADAGQRNRGLQILVALLVLGAHYLPLLWMRAN